MNPEKDCATNFGSEFKNTVHLEEAFNSHPRWSSLKYKLENGCDFPVINLTEEERLGDVEGSFSYGNHKSAIKHEKFLSDSLIKEVKKGWGLLILENDAKEIPGLEISPMGVAEHLGISDDGNYIPKKRITHDLSWPGYVSKSSLNARIDKDELEPIMFGHCLLRVIHYIVSLRAKYPNKKIFIRKEDLKSAYRRLHLNAKAAKRAAIRVKLNGTWYVIISLRLPFGGASCPADFCLFSDIIADSVNDLLACENWDENKVHSPFIKNVPACKVLDDLIPFGVARDLLVNFPLNDCGYCDVFIDDLITCAVNLERNLQRMVAAPCTVIHAFAKNCPDKQGLPRDDLIALDKCAAEGSPSEIKICLGWLLNTRSLTISLPKHKYIAWTKELQGFIDRKSCSFKALESMIGKLEHVISVFKILGHFMNNTYWLKLKAEIKSQHNVFIPHHVKEDFLLHKKFIKMVYSGVSMNSITFRKPDHYIFGDACEHGLGAFNEGSGRAFAFVIPKELRGRAHINLLEFLSQLIQIWLDILENRIKPYDCILACGDNTSAMGWLRRSNFRESFEDDEESNLDWLAKQMVARKLANLIIDSKAVLYSQWFCGEANVGSDSLSRDCEFLSSNTHETLLKKFATTQVPANLSISPLPNEIVCFVSSILRLLPVSKQRLKTPKASELLLGAAGWLSSYQLGLKTKSSSMEYQNFNKTFLCQRLHKPFGKQPSLAVIKSRLFQGPLKPPLHMYHRPSGQTLGTTPDWTQMEEHASCSKSNSGVTKI